MPELRRDMVRDNWVVIATDRALKPNDFPINKQGMQNAEFNGFCPFCEGNESFTPEEIAAFRPNGSQANSPGWQVRTVPNKFSAFQLEGVLEKQNAGMYSSYNGLGKHEVVVETPEHGVDLHQYSLERIEMIFKMLRDRYNELSKDERIKYIHMYKNRGLFAGASLGHSHSQIVGLPLVPNENGGITKHFEQTGHCLLCDILEQEIQDQQRVIFETDTYLLVCPYASRFSYETWIVPKKHIAHFGEIDNQQISELASILKHFINAMLECLHDPSYNMVIVSSPVNEKSPAGAYHWYIEISPRLIVTAGLEIGTGYYVNPAAPEF
jgi:UDPglucose--hexose-1-phosphate uridylyltransferase